MKHSIRPEDIDKYISGQCSPEEAGRIEAWYRSFEDYPDHVSGLSREQKELLKQKLLARVKHHIHGKDSSHNTLSGQAEAGTRSRVRTIMFRRWLRITAAVVILLGVVYLSKTYRDRFPAAPAPASYQANEVVTNEGHTLRKLTLPDTSKIWIYPGTRIEYGAFAGKRREIWLSGEAFFEVARDTLRPFLIHSENLTTKVLGTSFGIKAWPGDSAIHVSVRSGRVALLAGNTREGNQHAPVRSMPAPADSLVLASAQQAVFIKNTSSFAKDEGQSPPGKNIWARASLSFHDASLEEVVRTLSERFGTPITIASKGVAYCTLRADFSGQHLPTILEAICRSVNADYSILNDRITITGAGCDPPVSPGDHNL